MDKKKSSPKEFDLKHIGSDLTSGLVVFLVALPLCLGIALASGAPLFSGMIAGIVGGIVVALASGSPLSVTGPAAGLTAIVLASIKTLGSFEIFLLAVMLAGAIQLILGYLRAGIIGYYFPSSVIKGMLAAIGIILILKQIPHAIGYDKDNEGDFSFLQVDGENTFSELFHSLNFIHPGAVIIGLVSLFILIMWERPFLKKYAFFKTVPGALIVVVLGVVINYLYKTMHPAFYLEGEELVSLPVAKSTNDFIHQFTLPDFSAIGNYHVWVVAVTIAIVASLESLLSVEAADKLDPYKRITPTNRELKAQGLGNVISGLIGGLPLTAVIVRTSANISSGGKTKLSAIIHGIFLLVSVIGLASIMNMIPLACLAAVLLMVGYKLAKLSLFRDMYRLGWNQFLPFVITVVAIQFSDLLKGIGVGMVVSIFFILRSNFRRDYNVHQDKKEQGSKTVIELAENVSFLNKGSIATKLRSLPDGIDVVIDGSKCHYIDLDIVEVIHDFEINAPTRNINLQLIAIPEYKGSGGH
jgi:MFS superfamily sulfate permease-like transporter